MGKHKGSEFTIKHNIISKIVDLGEKLNFDSLMITSG